MRELIPCCASIILAVIVGILAGAAMLEEWRKDHPNQKENNDV